MVVTEQCSIFATLLIRLHAKVKKVCLTNKQLTIKMSKMTEKDQLTFREIYDSLPDRSAVKAPKTLFVERIADITMKSTKTVRCWLAGAQTPDPLSASMIEKELGVSVSILFPNKYQDEHAD